MGHQVPSSAPKLPEAPTNDVFLRHPGCLPFFPSVISFPICRKHVSSAQAPRLYAASLPGTGNPMQQGSFQLILHVFAAPGSGHPFMGPSKLSLYCHFDVKCRHPGSNSGTAAFCFQFPTGNLQEVSSRTTQFPCSAHSGKKGRTAQGPARISSPKLQAYLQLFIF